MGAPSLECWTARELWNPWNISRGELSQKPPSQNFTRTPQAIQHRTERERDKVVGAGGIKSRKYTNKKSNGHTRPQDKCLKQQSTDKNTQRNSHTPEQKEER